MTMNEKVRELMEKVLARRERAVHAALEAGYEPERLKWHVERRMGDAGPGGIFYDIEVVTLVANNRALWEMETTPDGDFHIVMRERWLAIQPPIDRA